MNDRGKRNVPVMRRHRRWAFQVTLSVACGFWYLVVLSAPGLAWDARDLVETRIGMQGTCHFSWNGPALETAPVEEKTPLVLRIANVERSNGAAVYELRFVGHRAGQFDLGDFLRRADGQPLSGLPPLAVRVVEHLPADHDGSLEELTGPGLPRFWRYRWTLWFLAAAWAIPLGVAIVRWSLRRKRRPIVAEIAQPTFADQLQPLVAAALAGSLSDADRARLEMLLIAYWRDRLKLRGLAPQAAILRMREHPEAGQLLRQLERWLHQRPQAATVDIAVLLAPYRHDPAIDDPNLPPYVDKLQEGPKG